MKIRVGVVFGGRSGEHEVSLRSAQSIIDAINKDKYEVVPIAITREGKWLTSEESLVPEIVVRHGYPVALLSDATHPVLVRIDAQMSFYKQLDVAFPVLHGTYGEDGTIQGLFEIADIPYVGCGVLASAVGMDKILMKKVFAAYGLPVVENAHFLRSEWERDKGSVLRMIEERLRYPVFVKPANLGSSVGISKVKSAGQLVPAIELACKYDRRIIVEQGVDAREFELSVLGNDDPKVSLPGEIIPGAEFYDYNDKYVDDKTRFELPAKLPDEVILSMQQLALQAFRAIDASGMARVDLFMERQTGKIYLNEINTIPGFTSISMYPKLWQISGVSYPELVEQLIELALERKRDRSRNLIIPFQ
ncbi:MAG: D-alanine--D-alanine ligase [Acidobacteriota bacterium]|nr:D-alanine--D-alanine ligase [Blastocatellia bacterium]MDW8411664.1 D-alanine--D-alanine ligase [Acidobacteriota bacterium]